MNHTLAVFLVASVVLPFLVSAVLAAAFRAPERWLSRISTVGGGLWFIACAGTIVGWLVGGGHPQELYLGELYQSGDYDFSVLLLIDSVAAVYLGVTAFLGTLILRYCRYYLHREVGYARFFMTIFLFLGGMSAIICSGTFELFFAGWEILGLASFLLIGFYRERPTAQKNALRAFIVYRFCDIGLLLGAWLGHLIWHETRSFLSLAQPDSLGHVEFWPLVGLSFLVLLAASGKSAQFPFCFWLPRAMEGPTPSSAIFYGALSVHAGVLLLFRTTPIWESLGATRMMVGGVGLFSAAVATLSGRVQSNIKAQIGYASIAQVGLMLFELSLGLHWVALFHFVANAMLRCYQLLVSPSVVAHLLRVQAATTDGTLSDWSIESRWIPRKMQSSFYVLAFQEGFFEYVVLKVLWDPFCRISRSVNRLNTPFLRTSGSLGAIGVVVYAIATAERHSGPLEGALAILMLVATLVAFAEMRNAFRAWNALGLSALVASAAVCATGTHALSDALLHLAGIVPAWALGLVALRGLVKDSTYDFRWHYGLAYAHPLPAFLLLVSALGISGFPITTAFLGEDLLLHHAARGDLWLAVVITIGFVINGIVAMRMYSRLCLGRGLALAAIAAALLFFSPPAEAVEFAPYGFIKAGVVAASRAVESFGNANLSAPNRAYPFPDAPFNDARSSFQLSQSRVGVHIAQKDPISGQVEVDFIDFDKASPVTRAVPRLRVAAIRLVAGPQDTFIVGQDWDVFSPAKPHTFNFVGLYFGAGNVGFLRPQVKWEHTAGKLQFQSALGLPGLNSTTTDSDLERVGVPSMSAMAAYASDKDNRFGISAIGGKLRFSASNTWPGFYGLNAFYEGGFGAWGELRAEAYYGENLGNTGALSLAISALGESRHELGGYLTWKVPVTASFSGQLGVGYAAVMESEGSILKGITGYKVNENLRASAAASYRVGSSVDLYLEASVFQTIFREDATQYRFSQLASVVDSGAVLWF